MTSDDPWKGIVPPRVGARQISARRVVDVGPWGLYWAVDAERHLLLILQHGASVRRSRRLPRLRGLRVEAQPAESGSDGRILIRLTDPEQRDIFLRFCRDIIDATTRAETEEHAVERFLARTWRWHRLLRSGRDGRLTADEQRGLIGELSVLERHLMPSLGALDAVRCWTGPAGAPHDFEVSRTHIEAKACGSGRQEVRISSEHQLAPALADRLLLYVLEVSTGAEEAAGAFTLTDLARRIRDMVARQDPAAGDLIEERLDDAGFRWADDYSDRLWVTGREFAYDVAGDFPRLTPEKISGGVEDVRYTVSLPECQRFLLDISEVARILRGASDDG